MKSTLAVLAIGIGGGGMLVSAEEPPTASAILDRFLQHAEIVTFQGRSYRLKDRQANEDTNPASPKTGQPAPPKPANAPTGKERGIRPPKGRTTDNGGTS
jgi:hypothetical protein